MYITLNIEAVLIKITNKFLSEKIRCYLILVNQKDQFCFEPVVSN